MRRVGQIDRSRAGTYRVMYGIVRFVAGCLLELELEMARAMVRARAKGGVGGGSPLRYLTRYCGREY